MENLCLHVPGKFSFSVFQFLRKYSEIVPETEKLKNWKTKKLKNWKTVFSRGIQEEILHMDSVFQFFSFSVFQFLRKYSEIVPETEKLKNWIHMENLFLDLSGKNSFSVFQFWFRKYSGIVPALFRNEKN